MIWGSCVYFTTDGNTNPCIFWAYIHLFIAHLILTMSVQPFLFAPTCPPGEEPSDSQGEDWEDEEEGGELAENGLRIGSTQWSREWCICWGCEAVPTNDEYLCCQELADRNQKFDRSVVKQRDGEALAFAVFSCSMA